MRPKMAKRKDETMPATRLIPSPLSGGEAAQGASRQDQRRGRQGGGGSAREYAQRKSPTAAVDGSTRRSMRLTQPVIAGRGDVQGVQSTPPPAGDGASLRILQRSRRIRTTWVDAEFVDVDDKSNHLSGAGARPLESPLWDFTKTLWREKRTLLRRKSQATRKTARKHHPI